MGDECTCDKCQAVSVDDEGSVVWSFERPESQAEGRGRPPRGLYVIISEGGVSLRQQTLEM